MALNGSWKKLWPEAVNDFHGLPNQQDEIISLLTNKVPGEGFPDLEEADIQEFFDAHAAELTEKNLEQLTAFS